MENVGALAGLLAAACWAMASVFYTRVPIGAGAMTTFKNTLAAFCLGIVLWISSSLSGQPMFQASWSTWWDIGVSGIVGLSLADIAYFRSIQILGPRQGLTLTLLTPPATAILAQVWLGDRLSVTNWVWILTTVAGIGGVMRARPDRTADQELRPGSTPWGVSCALLGVATMAVGSVILKRGTTGIDAIEGTFVRLFVASIFGILLSVALGQVREIVFLLGDRQGTRRLCLATLLGTVVGVYLMLVAFKYCPTGIAATLTSTSPLFVIPVVYVAYKQTVAPLALLGAVVAFTGVCGLLLGR